MTEDEVMAVVVLVVGATLGLPLIGVAWWGIFLYIIWMILVLYFIARHT